MPHTVGAMWFFLIALGKISMVGECRVGSTFGPKAIQGAQSRAHLDDDDDDGYISLGIPGMERMDAMDNERQPTLMRLFLQF